MTKKKRYIVTYIPRLRQRDVRTQDIKKFINRLSKGDCEKIYSVIDMETCQKLEV